MVLLILVRRLAKAEVSDEFREESSALPEGIPTEEGSHAITNFIAKVSFFSFFFFFDKIFVCRLHLDDF